MKERSEESLMTGMQVENCAGEEGSFLFVLDGHLLILKSRTTTDPS